MYEGWLYLANLDSKSKKISKKFPTAARKWFYEDATSGLTTTQDGI